MKRNVYAKSGCAVPIMRDQDGTPLCIVHGHKMEEIDENIWQCPWEAEEERELHAALVAWFAAHSVDEIVGRRVPPETK